MPGQPYPHFARVTEHHHMCFPSFTLPGFPAIVPIPVFQQQACAGQELQMHHRTLWKKSQANSSPFLLTIQSLCWEHQSTPFQLFGAPIALSSHFFSEKRLVWGHNSGRDIRPANPSAAPVDLLMQLSAKCTSFCDIPCNPLLWFNLAES